LRVTNLARHHVQVVPAVVSPKRRHQGSEEARHAAFGAGKFGGEVRPRPATVRKADGYDSEDDRDLEQGKEKLEISRAADADVVQPGDQDGGCNRHELPVGDCEEMGTAWAREESIGKKRKDRESLKDPHQARSDRRDRRRLGDQKPGPRIEKSRQRAISVANIHILAARLRLHRA